MATKVKVKATREQIDRLARAVEDRRIELGMTQLEVNLAGGPSTTTLSHFEDGTAPSPIPKTLKRLDRGLSWAPYSAQECLWKGIPPTPLPTTSVVAAASLGGELSPVNARAALSHLRSAKNEIDQAISLLLASEQPGV